jgi:hypothetical protein
MQWKIMKFFKNNNKLKIRILYKSILFSLIEHSKIMSPLKKKNSGRCFFI